jgi:starch phosphorylase
LLLRDPERLARILNDPQRPVQVIYAGKAHPHDDGGKHLIQAIVGLAKRPEFRKKLVFLENYDMAVARYMVQGCDIWLNTPLRPLEASGTSGMKAQANGALNVSTLDGWWDEAYRDAGAAQGEIGWAIGNGETYSDPGYQDQVEAEALYELLEREIVPLFYRRKTDGLPTEWIARMKVAMGRLCSQFNMHRAVMQYADEYYEVAHQRHVALSSEDAAKARSLAAWLKRVEEAWPGVCVETVQESASEIELGEEVDVSARVHLAPLGPEDVAVQVLVGRVDADSEIIEPAVESMQALDGCDQGSYVFKVTLHATKRSGLHGYAIRVLPKSQESIGPFLPGLILWANCAVPVHV